MELKFRKRDSNIQGTSGIGATDPADFEMTGES
jgi:hypothetical protein